MHRAVGARIGHRGSPNQLARWLIVIQTYLLAAALVGAVSVLALTRPNQLTPLQVVLSAAIVIVGMLPTVLFGFSNRQHLIPFIQLHGAYYAIAYGATNLIQYGYVKLADSAALTTALFYALLGILATYLGYGYIGTLSRGVRPLRVDLTLSDRSLFIIGAVFVGCDVATRVVPAIAALPSASQAVFSLGFLGSCFLAAVVVKQGVRAWVRVPAIAVLGAYVLVRLAEGTLAPPMLIGATCVVMYWYHRRRIPWLVIGTVIVGYALINPTKNEIRATTWGGNYTLSEQVDVFLDVAWEQLSDFGHRSQFEEQKYFATSLTRLGGAQLFARTLEQIPAHAPFWEGRSLLPLLTKPIPRIFWADKPEENIGNTFGRIVIGVLDPGDYVTAVNIPWIVDLYANFGLAGIVVGMTIIGIFLRYLVEKFSGTPGNPLRFYFGVALVLPLFWAESNISGMLGGLFWSFVLYYVTFRALRVLFPNNQRLGR